MIIVTRRGVTDEELDHIRERIETLGLRTHVSRGEHRTIIGCVGDEERLQSVPLLSIPGVEAVHPVLKPYKLASREFAADQGSRVSLGSCDLGGDDLIVVAGPCSVEGLEMLQDTGRRVRAARPRPRPVTSPSTVWAMEPLVTTKWLENHLGERSPGVF